MPFTTSYVQVMEKAIKDKLKQAEGTPQVHNKAPVDNDDDFDELDKEAE